MSAQRRAPQVCHQVSAVASSRVEFARQALQGELVHVKASVQFHLHGVDAVVRLTIVGRREPTAIRRIVRDRPAALRGELFG